MNGGKHLSRTLSNTNTDHPFNRWSIMGLSQNDYRGSGVQQKPTAAKITKMNAQTNTHKRVDTHEQKSLSHADRLTLAMMSVPFDRDNPVASGERVKLGRDDSQTRKSRLEAEGTKPRQREKEEEKQEAERHSQANPDTRGQLCLIDQENRRKRGGMDTECEDRLLGGRRSTTGRREGVKERRGRYDQRGENETVIKN